MGWRDLFSGKSKKDTDPKTNQDKRTLNPQDDEDEKTSEDDIETKPKALGGDFTEDEWRNAHRIAERNVEILHDFGLTDKDILEFFKEYEGEYTAQLIRDEKPADYLIALYDGTQSEPLRDMNLYQYENIHWILSECRGVTLYSDWKYEDEVVIVFGKEQLERHAVELEFSKHEWDKEFNITAKRGEETHSTIFHYKDLKTRNLPELVEGVNKVLAPFDLFYHEIKSGGDCYNFVLMKTDQQKALMKKYGNEFKLITDGARLEDNQQ